MAEVVIPEIKHEYIRQVDTETTKDDWFDECIADNKEAAWAGIGTSENDSQYQPAPSVEPDYYMQYCSSDDYDYLKDYRLIWGYGIGIIEQDVICSLSTGEHLAEGKDACDTYATENAAGENIDWKRGTWIKFSGNRNVSPTRIGEVILPERIISLKDLCVALQLNNDCHFVFPITNFDNITNTTVLNTSNMCGQNNRIIIDINSEVSFNMTTLNCSYMFADATIGEDITDRLGFIESLTQAIDFNHCFYKTKFINTFEHIDCSNVLSSANVESMFEESNFNNAVGTISYNGPVGKATFKNCIGVIDFTSTFNLQSDVESAFEGTTIINTGSRDETNPENDDLINWNSIDFSKVTNAKRMFYDITCKNSNEMFLDLSTVVEHENGSFDNFIYSINYIKLNLKASNCKLKGIKLIYGFILNIINELKVYDYDDLIEYDNSNSDSINTYIIGGTSDVKGTIVGTWLFHRILNDNSNVILKTKEFTEEELAKIFDFYKDKIFPTIFVSEINAHNINNISFSNINLDNYFFINAIRTIWYSRNTNIDVEYTTTINVDKTNKNFCIIINNDYINGYNLNIIANTDCYLFYTKEDNVIGIFSDYVNYINYCNINIDSQEEHNIYLFPKTHTDYINNNNNSLENYFNYQIDSPKYTYIIDYKNCNRAACNFKNLKKLDVTYPGNKTTSHGYDIIGDIIGIENIEQIDLKGFCADSNNCIKLYTISENIHITSNYIINNFNVISPIIIIGHKYKTDDYININTPTYTHENGDIDYICVKGTFKNTDIKNFVRRATLVSYENNDYDIRLEPTIYRHNTDTDNYVLEQIIDNDLNYNILTFNNTSKISGSFFSLTGNFENYIFNSNSNYNRINLDTVNNSIYDINEYLTINSFKYKSARNIRIYNIKSSNIIFSLNSVTGLEFCNCLFDNTVTINGDVEQIEFNIDYKYDITNLLLNCVGIKICDLTNLDKLTQESINSIVTPTNFASGCTLTINTIPFQYITEEQKQALTDAGVTLVEYIPTETTE